MLGAKRSIAEMVDEVFGPATPDQMQVLHGVADLELDGDQTGWSLAAARTGGLMELVELEHIVNGRPFIVPSSNPGTISVESMAHAGLRFLVVEQDLMASGHGLFIKIVGGTDKNGAIFPWHGGFIIKDRVEKFLVARVHTSGAFTTLQATINEAILANMLTGKAGGSGLGSGPPTGFPGGSELVKKATLNSVLDMNGDVRVVFSKEGGHARLRTYAALLREWAPERIRVFLGADYNSTMGRIRDGMMSESERAMVPGDAMLSLSRMDTIVRLAAWQDQEAFQHFLLLDLPMSDWQFSLKQLKSPEASMWGRDCDRQGSENLLGAIMNWFNFQRVTKDELFHRCGDPIRELFEDQSQVVSRYYNDFLQFQLERMIRGYAQELTQTEGKVARLAGGLALGGQGESVALLQWFVKEFVGLA